MPFVLYSNSFQAGLKMSTSFRSFLADDLDSEAVFCIEKQTQYRQGNMTWGAQTEFAWK